MRRLNLALLLAVALAVLAGGSSATAGRGPAQPATPSGSARLLVKFRAGTSATAAAEVVHEVGATRRATVPRLGVQVLSIPTDASTRALARLSASPHVKFVERDATVKPQEMIPNDPSFPQTFAIGGGAWGWYKTHTTQAWDITTGDPSVIIAILDSGLKTKGLADYSGQLVPGWNVLNSTSDTSTNAGNHGTYVAGVAGLASSNGVGNTGYCPRCKLMPVQVGTDSYAYWSDVATGIIWAADHGARVENLSWAGTSDSQTMQNAINYAHSKGVVITAAAGNTNCDCKNFPAADQNVIGVAGTDSVDNKAGDSNYGGWVSVAAPEGTITSWPTINGAPGYAPVGGTSVAAPAVAGIAALLFSANPALTNTQVEQALEQTAMPVDFVVAHGRVDALAALNYVGFTDPQPSSAPVNTAPPQIMLETNGDWNFTPLTSAPQPGQVLLRGQGSWIGSAPLSLSAVTWQRCDSSGTSCGTAATTTRYTVQAADAGSTLRLSVTVKNALGQTTLASALTQPVGSSAPAAPPVNTAPPVLSGLAQEGQALQTSNGTWSNAPTGYAYQWLRCDASGTNCAEVGGATSASYLLTSADVGSTLRSRVTASNSGGSATADSSATAPVASTPPPPPATQSFTFTGTLTRTVGSQSFAATLGAGETDATLTFSKSASVSLKLLDTSGVVVGQISGTTSPLKLNLPGLMAGPYAYIVSGSGFKGSLSFTLTVTTAGA